MGAPSKQNNSNSKLNGLRGQVGLNRDSFMSFGMVVVLIAVAIWITKVNTRSELTIQAQSDSIIKLEEEFDKLETKFDEHIMQQKIKEGKQ